MARPSKPCCVGQSPRCRHFRASCNSQNGICLTMEEYEAIRLIDYAGMNQEQCAAQMQVSRATVQSVYSQARKKLARFLVEGAYLEIGGGNYQLIHENKGGVMMKIAVTYENGEVFQHFGHTEQFKIYDVEDGKIVSSEVKDTNGQGHGALATFLQSLNIDTLICGGIGGGARNALAEAGIRLFPGAVGNADSQVEAFLAGTLSYDPDTQCNHHHHEGEGHECRHGSCGH